MKEVVGLVATEEWSTPDGETLQTFSTITTDANHQLSKVQPRMPVIIEQADWPIWLGEEDGDVRGFA